MAPSTELPPFRAGLFQLDPFALLGTRCTACGEAGFPARSFCAGCRADGDAIVPATFAERGEVVSFTVVRQAPAGVEVPYVLARVLVDEGPRVMAQIVGAASTEVEIGDRVRVVPAVFPSADGSDRAGFAFQIEQEENA
ncbi:Zn-ribbon domain-containing OB-fold protein [Micromonospora sp. NPDC049048]|uniref:Zn-ribbon domain-containing OB-fold protein n=1 Tax=Micromonospora sp. NPDC049048 TaxID=3364263 RepID=UPI003713C540